MKIADLKNSADEKQLCIEIAKRDFRDINKKVRDPKLRKWLLEHLTEIIAVQMDRPKTSG